MFFKRAGPGDAMDWSRPPSSTSAGETIEAHLRRTPPKLPCSVSERKSYSQTISEGATKTRPSSEASSVFSACANKRIRTATDREEGSSGMENDSGVVFRIMLKAIASMLRHANHPTMILLCTRPLTSWAFCAIFGLLIR